MNLSYNISFKLESRKKDNLSIKNNVSIIMRIYYNRHRFEINTGHRIDKSGWNSAKQRVKPSYINKHKVAGTVINKDLQIYEELINSVFNSYNYIPEYNRVKLDILELIRSKKKKPKKQTCKVKDETIYPYYDEFIDTVSRINNWTHASYEKFSTLKKHLLEFDPKLTFDSLDEFHLTDFIYFLSDKKDMCNTSVDKRLRQFKTFLRWATKKGYNKNMEYTLFRPKINLIEKRVIFLTKQELKKIQECKIPDDCQYLDRVRDVFLFQCYSGLRYSDVANLKKCDVHQNTINITTVKTRDTLEINLNNYTRAILDKYRYIELFEDKALPVISNQRMNDYVKKLAKLAGICNIERVSYMKGNRRIDEYKPKYELIGTHTGRRTFICNALALGIPVNVVMKWTGHSDYKAMKPYIDVADGLKAEMMERFNTL